MTPESLAALLIAPWQIVAVIFNLILLVPVVLSIICLMVYQLNLIAENITTIEEYEKVVLTKRAKKNGEVLTPPSPLVIFFTHLLFRNLDGTMIWDSGKTLNK